VYLSPPTASRIGHLCPYFAAMHRVLIQVMTASAHSISHGHSVERGALWLNSSVNTAKLVSITNNPSLLGASRIKESPTHFRGARRHFQDQEKMQFSHMYRV
jgi:hypothetical protein